MANRPKFTAAQVADALTATRGLVFLAAQALGCDPDTVQRYCKRYPSVEAAKQAARGTILDVAEAKLMLAVQREEAWAITFTLKTLGRTRGYAESLDIHLTIQAAAARVAEQCGRTPQEVLAEAKLLLQEVDDAHRRPTWE
jgi:hypothetical protein